MDSIYVDLEPVGVTIILGTALGIFFLCRYGLKRWTKPKTKLKLLIGSLLATLLLTPLIFGLVAAIQIYRGYALALVESNAKIKSSTEADVEQIMNQLLETEELRGKTKQDIVTLLGITDTTSDRLMYGFSIEKKPYILEIQFENGRVVDYTKKDK